MENAINVQSTTVYPTTTPMFMRIHVTLLNTFLDFLCLYMWVNLYM